MGHGGVGGRGMLKEWRGGGGGGMLSAYIVRDEWEQGRGEGGGSSRLKLLRTSMTKEVTAVKSSFVCSCVIRRVSLSHVVRPDWTNREVGALLSS